MVKPPTLELSSEVISLACRHLQGGMEGEGMEDYGDYVTRCICEFKHDDGYMIACDGCR